MSNSFPCYDSWWQQEKENINPLPAKTTSDKKKQPDNQPIPLRRHPLSDITELVVGPKMKQQLDDSSVVVKQPNRCNHSWKQKEKQLLSLR